MTKPIYKQNLQRFCSIESAVSSVAITAFEHDGSLPCLFELSATASGVLEAALSELSNLSSSDRRVLVFSLNLVKDIAMAKAVALVVSSEGRQ